jgi:hypothetical protein
MVDPKESMAAFFRRFLRLLLVFSVIRPLHSAKFFAPEQLEWTPMLTPEQLSPEGQKDGPVVGVRMWDFEQVAYLRQAGTTHRPCTLRSCEGVDLFESIKKDLDPWRQR